MPEGGNPSSLPGRDENDGAGPGRVGEEGSALGSRVHVGALWSGASVILMRLSNIALMVVVARIVVPEQFGTFTSALVVHAMLVSIAELGVSAAIARSDLDPDEIAPTVATISIVTSLLLAIGMAVFASQLANLLGTPGATAPLRILAITVALIGPFAVPGAQLQREFRQRSLFGANLASFVASSAVLLVLALVGDGAVAFAWSRVVGYLVMGVMMVRSVSRVYRPGFAASRFGPLLRFSLPLAGANLLSQLLLNVDYVFVGRLQGPAQLGIYTLAFNIAAWPLAVMGSILNGVVLPAISTLRQQGGDLVRGVAQATRTVTVVAFPISAMTMALASPLTATLYGPRWTEAAAVLQVLALYGAIFVVCLLFANIIIAMGRTGTLLAVQVAALVALAPAIAVGIDRMGLVGVGAAHIVVIMVVTLPVYLLAIRRSTATPVGDLVRAATPAVVSSLVAGGVAFLVSNLVAPAPFRLILGGAAGLAFYLLTMAPFVADLLPASLTTPARIKVVADGVGRQWSRWGLVEGRDDQSAAAAPEQGLSSVIGSPQTPTPPGGVT